MKAIKIIALASLLASMFISGCKDDGDEADAGVVADAGIRADGGDAAVTPPDGGDAGVDPPDGGPGDTGLLFSDFVRDLILNQTNETGSPVDLPNPDLPDNEDTAPYDTLP
jgi:hypothetical protein